MMDCLPGWQVQDLASVAVATILTSCMEVCASLVQGNARHGHAACTFGIATERRLHQSHRILAHLAHCDG
jgi:hypothetical protein